MRVCIQTIFDNNSRMDTTGYSRFAECQGHSANAQKHSANTLPSVTLGIQHTALICRQTVVCRVFFIGHSANSLPTVSKHSAKINSRQKKIWQDGTVTSILPSAQRKNTRQSFSSLPSVMTKTLGKVSQLCRVSTRKHSVKFFKFAECHAKNTRQTSEERLDFIVTSPSVHRNTLVKAKTLSK